MIIDRHNYEECFILYWDNELTSSQKQAVENFVKENPDLEQEFKILGQTRFTPDNNIHLEEKEFLLNNSFINITNYEEQLLNYIDEEVTTEQRKEVERFAGQYSAVKQELALLQKTKLQPEAEVVFPDKSILYRREEKVRVISMTWFRVAVAAAIILIAGFATFRLVNTNKNGDTPPVARVEKSNDQSSKKANSLSNPGNSITKESLVKGNEKSPKEQTIDKNNNQNRVDKNDDQKPLIAQRENKNHLPEERMISDRSIANPTDNASDIALIPKANNEAQEFETNKTNIGNPSVTISSPISFAKIDDVSNDDNFGKKEGGGIKEFLRKTTRVFERRTRIQTTTDDNKLLVGAFAVSLK